MRILVVGGGVIGLLTAVEAVAAGHRVVVCDQGTIPNPRATSHDRHRVLRALHPGDAAATAAAARAHHAWTALADRLAAGCYRRVGAVSVLPRHAVPAALADLAEIADIAEIANIADSADSAGRPVAWVEPVPHVVLPPGTAGVFEADAGVLLADRVLAAAAAWLAGHPQAELREHHRAVAVDADRATVRFAGGDVLGADAVLLAPGPWARELVPESLRPSLTLFRQSLLYCDAPGPVWRHMPSVRGLGDDGAAWLVPPVADTPLKLSAATACREVAEVTDHATPPRWRDHLVGVWSRIIPGFHAGLVTAASDCYYLAPAAAGGSAALARLGPSVLSFAACGGGAFKFAPLVARALVADLTGARPLEPDVFPHLLLPHSTLRGAS
ncbi:FAD-dependent oxidoreductase [Dactylosporangium sp. NPDC048998]|uniref:FAD-dependent oxidoreductase n=1 Tax=Dactylosporangium sp. NPDC048998 TaxID=3363976 RepID=UPI0037238FAF